MKSPNFHSEISILTFLLLWSMSQFPFCATAEELKDVQVKIIKESKMLDYLKSSLVIDSACILARKDGIPIFIRKKGDPDAGIIFIKIDLLNNNVVLLRRNLNYVIETNKTFIEYVNLFPNKIVNNFQVDQKLKSEIAIDPDCWIVEIEDKKGKNYFENI